MRIVHVHHDNDSQIVIRGDGAIHHANQQQADQILLHRRGENVEFGEETAKCRNADQR